MTVSWGCTDTVESFMTVRQRHQAINIIIISITIIRVVLIVRPWSSSSPSLSSSSPFLVFFIRLVILNFLNQLVLVVFFIRVVLIALSSAAIVFKK